jgi:glycerol uptake facilitator-like aquaporin
MIKRGNSHVFPISTGILYFIA